MNQKLEISKSEPVAMARPTMPVINIESLINKAVDSKAAVEVVKELRAMLREDQEIAARAAFDEAMSEFQSKCPVIVKGKGVPDKNNKIAYRFAPIEKVEEVIRPIERECGFTHTFNQDVTSLPGWVIASVRITHALGHFIDKVGKFPLGTRTHIMSDTQQYAAALTFANRRVLGNAYGLVFSGEDKDGSKPPETSTSGRVATEATRNWFLEQTRDIHVKLQAYAIDRGHILPNEGLEAYDLNAVPTNKTALAALRREVEAMP
jgi:hypothetical protein